MNTFKINTDKYWTRCLQCNLQGWKDENVKLKCTNFCCSVFHFSAVNYLLISMGQAVIWLILNRRQLRNENEKKDENSREPTLATPDGRRRSRSVARVSVHWHNYLQILFVQNYLHHRYFLLALAFGIYKLFLDSSHIQRYLTRSHTRAWDRCDE